MKRETGYYWTRNKESWNICLYLAEHGFWTITGNNIKAQDEYFEEIDERAIVRTASKNELSPINNGL